MTTTQIESLADLYERDETAWLEEMAKLAEQGRHAELDLVNLSEYLTSMALSDRRQVQNRLTTLLSHLLKWEHQPAKRTGSWSATIREQRRKLRLLLESRTLRNHAEVVLARAFADARLEAADETELDLKTFPTECAWDLDQIVDANGGNGE